MNATVSVKPHTRRRPSKPRAYIDMHERLSAFRERIIGEALVIELDTMLAAFVAEVKREMLG